MYSTESGLIVADFRPELQAALDSAIPIVDEDPLSIGNKPELDRDKPDDHVIHMRRTDVAYRVATPDVRQYTRLLSQAIQVMDRKEGLTPKDEVFVADVTEHEIAHGGIAKLFGNSSTVSYYGVQFGYNQRGTLEMLPFHEMTGPLRKIHHAWSALAPKDPSETDIAVARGLGYTQGAETLRAMALEVPPIGDDYELPFEFGIDGGVVAMFQKFLPKD